MDGKRPLLIRGRSTDKSFLTPLQFGNR